MLAKVPAAILVTTLAIQGLGAADAIIRLNEDVAAKMAKERSAEIMAARAQANANNADASLQTAYMRPALYGQAGYTRSDPERVKIDNPALNAAGIDGFPQGREDDYRASLVLDQHLYTFGRWSASKMSSDALRAIGAASQAMAERDVAARARSALVQCLYHEGRLQFARTRVEHRESELRDVKAVKEGGRATSSDVRKAEINLTLAQAIMLATVTEREQAQLQVESAIGRRAGEVIEVGGVLARPADMAQLFKTAQQNIAGGSESARLSAEQSLRQGEAGQAAAMRWPQIGARGEYGRSGEETGDMDTYWKAGVYLEWRFYDRGTIGMREDAANGRRKAAEAQRQALLRDRKQALDRARIQMDSLAKQIALQEKTVELAEQNYDDLRDAFSAGRATFIQVEEGSQAVDDARLGLLDLFDREALLAVDLKQLAE